MSTSASAKTISVFCDQCDQLNDVPQEAHRFFCDRCGHQLKGAENPSRMHSLVYAVTAFIFYVPALMFPFMSIEMNGIQNSSTIWQGVKSLMDSGSWLIAFIVFVASIFVPVFKLFILFYLGIPSTDTHNALLKTRLYRFVENIGRWSMLDIFLLAVLIAILKIAPWTHVQPEIGSVLFGFVVIFSIASSATFDPRIIWKGLNNE